VTKLCRRLEEPGKVPTLLELADLVGLSPSHVQRTFSREMGVSPHQYGKARRIEGLRSELRSGTDVTSAVYEVGFNSNSVAYAQAKPDWHDSRVGATADAANVFTTRFLRRILARS